MKPIAAFQEYLEVERQYSPETVTAYLSDLQEFQAFLKANGEFTDFRHVDDLDVQTYLTDLNKQDLARTSIARKISSLRSFYRYLTRIDVVKRNPFELVELKSSIIIYHNFSMKPRFRNCSRQLLAKPRWINVIALCWKFCMAPVFEFPSVPS